MKFLAEFCMLFSVLQCIPASKLPSSIQRCRMEDFSCLKKSVQDSVTQLRDGSLELGLPSLDPFLIPKMTIGESVIIQCVQNYENMFVIGLSKAEVTNLNLDLNENLFTVDIEVPLLVLKARYVVKGKVLTMDVYGNGNSSITLDQVVGKFTMNFEIYNENGEQFVRATNPELLLQCQHAAYQFDNLFDGDKALGDIMNKVLNDNWRDIKKELLPSYATAIGLSLTEYINKIWLKVPMNELFIL